jgi:lysophospholipase L1-like esterase
MGILDVPSYSKTQSDSLFYSKSSSDSLFAKKSRIRAAALQGALGATYSKSFPDIATATSDIPTITVSTSSGVTSPKSISLNDENLRFVAAANVFRTSTNTQGFRWKTPLQVTVDFVLIGTTVELVGYGTTGSSAGNQWIWVNGKPITAAPVYYGSVSGLTTSSPFYTTLVFPDSTPKQISIQLDTVEGVRTIQCPITSSISTAPRKLKGLYLGDSFFGGITGTSQLSYVSAQMGRLLDTECSNYGQGGSGYISGGTASDPFGSSARIAYATAYQPDYIVICGSVNDNGQTYTDIYNAAVALYSALDTACPNVPIIVFGPQPRDSTTTLSSNEQINNNAVRDAALLASNVIAFYDQVGNAAIPYATAGAVSAWSGGTAKTITSVSVTGGTSGVATVNSTAHGFTTGDVVCLAGLSTFSSLNNAQTITGTATNSFTFNTSAVPAQASVTAATGDGTTVTYTADNTFSSGQIVSITGLTTVTGSSLNLSNRTIASATSTVFTVSTTTSGTATGTNATAAIQITVSSATANKTFYNTNDLVSYIGSIWRWSRSTPAGNITPGGTTQLGWALMTYLYTGTGKVGATAGNGTRDLYLNNDGIHPSLDGATALANKMSSDVRVALLKFALS